MSGTKGWTEESWRKIREGGSKGGKLGGRGHPIGFMAGENHPGWKGGVSGPGYGPGWKAARRAVWERDKVCRSCSQAPDPDRRLDVHHVVERRDNGGNELSNLVGLHHGCHMKVHAGKLEIKD